MGRRQAPARLAHLFCELFTRFAGDRQARRHVVLPAAETSAYGRRARASLFVHMNRTLQELAARRHDQMARAGGARSRTREG